MNYAELIDKIPESEKPEILRLLRALDEAKAREAAQEHYLDFVKLMWPGFISGRHHKIMADAFERVAKGELKRLIINMPPRHDLKLSEEVPTTSGFKRIQDIACGDYVFGPDGAPRLVTGKSPVNRKPTYTVTTSDGASVTVSEDHLWTVRFRCCADDPYITLSTKDLYERQCRIKGASHIPKLPRLSPVEFPRADLPIDPYVLGVWLGDGNSHGASIGCGYGDMDSMRRQVEACGFQTTHNPKFQQFNILGLHEKLRVAGLLKNKHIPDAYLCASVDQRLALIQGLIDTDGCVTRDGKVTFHNTNEVLVDDFLTLVRSFGVKAKKTWRQTSYKGKPSQPSMRVSFKLGEAARLPRKAKNCRPVNGNFSRTIKVEPTGVVEETQCLQVANEDGLFVAGRGMLVTHNTKSEFASYLLPAWFLGKYPQKKIIQTAHTAELAVGFGRKVRNLVGSDDYRKVFAEVNLQSDSKAAGRWSTNKGGEYFAIGVGGAVTGKGADLLIIDDPHSEQEAMMGQFDVSVYDKVFEWYSSGPRQRLQPGGAIVIVMTRWAKRDLTGQIIDASVKKEGAGEWEVIELPAIMPSGEPLWPEFWSIDELQRLKVELPISKWSAQYQQDPTSEEGALIKRDWWNIWESEKAPHCEAVIVAMDTAFSKTERSDYSACVCFGVFNHPNATGKPIPNLILLDAWKDKLEFPELKAATVQYYKDWKPDMFIVEKKASGAPLIAELRNAGIPVQEFTPTRATGDKIVRVNAITDIFASGVVWAPDDQFAEEVVEECAAFPSGDHDDYVDAVTMALMRFRQGGFIIPTDEDDVIETPKFRKEAFY
jgi:predicted phage terminase large subunit-like protein